jgi:hypothetical protein
MAYNRPTCNCPDASAQKQKNISSQFFSEQFNRNWSTTDKGTSFGGIRNAGNYCIHELSVINYRGEMDQAFPNGIPYQPLIYEPSIPSSSKTTIGTSRQNAYGDSFL